jgi:WD40 repeat protein
MRAHPRRPYDEGICSLVVHIHGDKLISGSADELISVWSTNNWTHASALRGHDGAVYSLVVHGDNLLSCSGDSTIKVWSTNTWVCERTLDARSWR